MQLTVAASVLTICIGLSDASCRAGRFRRADTNNHNGSLDTLAVYVFLSLSSLRFLIFHSNILMATISFIGDTVEHGHGALVDHEGEYLSILNLLK